MSRRIEPPDFSGEAGPRVRKGARLSGRGMVVAVVLPLYVAWHGTRTGLTGLGRMLDAMARIVAAVIRQSWSGVGRSLRAALTILLGGARKLASLTGYLNAVLRAAWIRFVNLVNFLGALVVCPLERLFDLLGSLGRALARGLQQIARQLGPAWTSLVAALDRGVWLALRVIQNLLRRIGVLARWLWQPLSLLFSVAARAIRMAVALLKAIFALAVDVVVRFASRIGSALTWVGRVFDRGLSWLWLRFGSAVALALHAIATALTWLNGALAQLGTALRKLGAIVSRPLRALGRMLRFAIDLLDSAVAAFRRLIVVAWRAAMAVIAPLRRLAARGALAMRSLAVAAWTSAATVVRAVLLRPGRAIIRKLWRGAKRLWRGAKRLWRGAKRLWRGAKRLWRGAKRLWRWAARPLRATLRAGGATWKRAAQSAGGARASLREVVADIRTRLARERDDRDR